MELRGNAALVWLIHTIEEPCPSWKGDVPCPLSLLEGPWSLIPAGGKVSYSPARHLLICSSGSLVAMLGLWEWGHGEDFKAFSRTHPRASLIFVSLLILPGSPSWDLCLGQGHSADASCGLLEGSQYPDLYSLNSEAML